MMLALEIVPLCLDCIVALQLRIALCIDRAQAFVDRDQVVEQQRIDTLALVFRQDTHQVEIDNLRFRPQGLQQMEPLDFWSARDRLGIEMPKPTTALSSSRTISVSRSKRNIGIYIFI